MYSYNSRWNVDNNGFHYVGDKTNTRNNCDVILQILKCMFDEEKVIYENNIFCIPHDIAAFLDRETYDSLGLPPICPYSLNITLFGLLSDRDSLYALEFMKDDVTPFVNPERIGCLLIIADDEQYMLIKDQYTLVNVIEKHNAETKGQSADYRRQNLIDFANIKRLSQSSRTKLESYLKSTNIVIPKKISISLSKNDDGAILIDPIILNSEDIINSDKSANNDLSDRFRARYNKLNDVRPIYSLPDNTSVVFSDTQIDALKHLKQKNILNGQEKEEFLKAPQAFLDAEVFDLEHFSDRVLGIGEYHPRVFPFLKPFKESWLPPEGGLIIDGEEFDISPNDLQDVCDLIGTAIKSGDKSVKWNGKEIPANEDTYAAIDELIKTGIADKRPFAKISNDIQHENISKNVLIIFDNATELEYQKNQTERNVIQLTIAYPNALKKEVNVYPHQKVGFQRLVEVWNKGRRGFLLADDMGLGKTLQALMLMTWVREKMNAGLIKSKPMLVVAPVSLLKNWHDEYGRFFDTTIFGEPLELHGANLKLYKHNNKLNLSMISKESLVMTTYETLRDYQLSFGRLEWSVIVLDEAQKIKTPSAMMTNATKAMKYDFGLCMTGTPVENSWVDLWSIVDFALPGKLGCVKDFNRKYQVPLSNKSADIFKLGQELKSEVAPYILRRLKEDNLKGLPEKHIYHCPVEMPSEQLEAYLDVISVARRKMPDKYAKERKKHILQTIASLRNVSLHPDIEKFTVQSFADMGADEIINKSARLIKTFEILDNVRRSDEKAIIFLLSRKMQLILQRLINDKYAIDCGRPINGEVSGDRREIMINEFQQKIGFQVLILSPEAAGVGLNITAANNVIHLSRVWNPAKEDQATDRVYRIGQTKTVNVFLPMATHSDLGDGGAFDEKLDNLLNNKRVLSKNVLFPSVIDESEQYHFGEDLIGSVTQEEKTGFSAITMDDIDKLDPEIFEKYVAKIYEKQGYDVQLTPRSNDYGADVVIYPKNGNPGLILQCKHAENPLKARGPEGVMAVLSALGVYKRDQDDNFVGIVVTNASDYTNNAKKAAESNEITLYSRAQIIEWVSKIKITSGEIFY